MNEPAQHDQILCLRSRTETSEQILSLERKKKRPLVDCPADFVCLDVQRKDFENFHPKRRGRLHYTRSGKKKIAVLTVFQQGITFDRKEFPFMHEESSHADDYDHSSSDAYIKPDRITLEFPYPFLRRLHDL